MKSIAIKTFGKKIVPLLLLCVAPYAWTQQVALVDAPQPLSTAPLHMDLSRNMPARDVPGKDMPAAPVPAASAVLSPGASAPAADWKPKFQRWVDLNEMDFSLRYRAVTDTNGAHEFSQGQQRSIIDGKFKFDTEGKYGIAFHASSGRYFNWAYADFIGGGNAKAYLLEEAKMTPLQYFVFNEVLPLQPKYSSDSQLSGGWSFIFAASI